MLIFQRHNDRAYVKWQVRPVDLQHAGFSMIRQRLWTLISNTRPGSCKLQLISTVSSRGPLNWSTMRFLHILCFTFLLCGLCVRAEDETTEDNNEEKGNNSEEKVEDSSEENTKPEKPEKTDEITEENDILVLHSVNFDRALSENKYLLVFFCKFDFPYIIMTMIIVLTNQHSDLINARKHGMKVQYVFKMRIKKVSLSRKKFI